MKYRLITIFFILFISIKINAQKIILTSGKDLTGAGGTINYSVGQIVYTTNAQNESLAQGVQQPFEIQVILGIENLNISLKMSIYPNPTSDFLILKLVNINFTNLEYKMYNLQGKLLKSKSIVNANNRITLKDLPISTYFLKVLENDKIIKNFKIIKK